MTVLALAFASGCTLTPATRREAHERAATATLSGIVRDSATGRPLSGVTVSVHTSRRNPVESVDSTGFFRVPRLDSGAATIEISRRGFITAQPTVLLAAGRTETMSVALRRGTPPCCRLTGRWQVDLTLDSAGYAGAFAGVRRLAAGDVTFGDSVSPRARSLLPDETGPVREELGVSSIDLSPMLGAGYRPGGLIRELRSLGATEVDSTFETTTLASTFHGDSVEMDFMPNIDHMGLLLSGRISGDSIAGVWFQKRFCCGAHGRFVLRRAR